MAKIVILLVVSLAALCASQGDGRYRPFPARPFPAARPFVAPQIVRSYRPAGDGRYQSDNSGAYNKNDGKYYPDESGRYNPDGSGIYDGSNGRYDPDGLGGYKGKNDKYKQDKDRFGVGGSGGQYSGGGGQYTGGGGQYTGSGGTGGQYTGNTGGSGLNAGSGGVAKPIGSGAGIKPFGSGLGPKPTKPSSGAGSGRPNSIGGGIGAAAGFGTPVTIKQGSAAGKYDNRNYAIIRQDGHIDEDGYHYLYETENGILGEEQGKLHNRGTDQEAMKANGFFTYTGPDSLVYTVTYTADENGFLPAGDHIPTPPPIPEPIQRALEYQRQQGTL